MSEMIKSVYQTVHEFREPDRAKTTGGVAGVAPADDWPQKSQTLELDRKQARLSLAYDAVLIAVPILCLLKIALVIIAWHFDKGKGGYSLDQVSLLTRAVIEINGQMVTLFTIVFVIVVATLVKRHALFKAQEGSYISELEQFQGSVSLPSTLKLIWSLRAWNTKSIGLVVIWSFQYLGSQANKYEYRLVDSSRWQTSTIAVRGPNAPSAFDPTAPANISSSFNSINSQLLTQTNFYAESTTKKSRQGIDLYGMALLPDLNHLLSGAQWVPTMDLSPDRHGWYSMSQTSNIIFLNAYTSMEGTTFSHPSLFGQVVGELTSTSNYLNITCSAPILHDFAAFPNGTLINQSVSMNMTNNSPLVDSSGIPLRMFEIWQRWNSSGSPNGTTASAVSTCSIARVRVDSHVHCLSTGCLQNKIRWFNNTNGANSTSYSTPFDNDDFAAKFLSNLLLASGTQDDLNTPTSTNQLLSPYQIVGMSYPSGLDPAHGNYTPQGWTEDPSLAITFHQYLNMYFNTYYSISQDMVAGSPDWNAIDMNGTDGQFSEAFFKGALYFPHYSIAWEWIAIDLLSCLVLLYATVSSLLFRKWTIAPDILGTISSLTRDNPYSDLPKYGSTLSGIERARMLKTVKVQLCDVGEEGQDGKIVLARVDTGVRQIKPLKKTAIYM